MLFRRKLLQFHDNEKKEDGSGRPAYYGSCRTASARVKPTDPFGKAAGLDYEVDSADEWEEPEDGEDIASDCEDAKDKEDEDEEMSAADGFVVDDGYLSEDEGANKADQDFMDVDAAGEGESAGLALSADGQSSATFVELSRLYSKSKRIVPHRVLVVSALQVEGGEQKYLLGDPSLLEGLELEYHDKKRKIGVPAVAEEETPAKRRRLNDEQKATLQKAFDENPKLSKERKEELGKQLDIEPKTVDNFFRYKRQAAKKLAAAEAAAWAEAVAQQAQAAMQQAAMQQAAAAGKAPDEAPLAPSTAEQQQQQGAGAGAGEAKADAKADIKADAEA